MKIQVRYKKPYEEAINTELDLRKSNKGYNLQIDGKFYLPQSENPVIKNIEAFEHKELWMVLKEDRYNYGVIAFASPDFFVVVNEERTKVAVEKEVPLNFLDNPDKTFQWDYLTLAEVSSVEQTDLFIDELEAKGCPEQIIKQALDEFYNL